VAVAVVTLVATAVVAAAAGTPNGQWWEFALLTAGAIGGGIFEVRIGPSSYISGIFVFSIIAAAFLGPLAAFLTPTIACVVSGLVHKARRIAILGNCAVAGLPNDLRRGRGGRERLRPQGRRSRRDLRRDHPRRLR
jgi:hypothetical protein